MYGISSSKQFKELAPKVIFRLMVNLRLQLISSKISVETMSGTLPVLRDLLVIIKDSLLLVTGGHMDQLQ
jgi:hypothetical protein